MLSRPVERRCIVCGAPVTPCARLRAHSLEEIEENTHRLLTGFAAQTIAQSAVDALLQEARVTPKPSLVDMHNSGAHRDMDLALMKKSARSLFPFLHKAVLLGMESGTCAPALQSAVIEAEKTMFCVTGGVNTHMALFSLSVFSSPQPVPH